MSRDRKSPSLGRKIEAPKISQVELPKTKKMLHKSLAALIFYRGMVSSFSFYTAELYNRRRKNFDFKFEKYSNKWNRMIDQFKNRVTLNRPNFDEPFILQLISYLS